MLSTPSTSLPCSSVFVSLWIPFFYVREFSSSALHVSKSEFFVILITLNAAGIPGRIVPALLADLRVGTINTYIVILFIIIVTLLLWPLVTTRTGMTIWTLAYGFGAAGVSSFLQAGLTSINDEPSKKGQKIGMAFPVVGVASLLGGPVGGEIDKDWGEDKEGDGCICLDHGVYWNDCVSWRCQFVRK